MVFRIKLTPVSRVDSHPLPCGAYLNVTDAQPDGKHVLFRSNSVDAAIAKHVWHNHLLVAGLIRYDATSHANPPELCWLLPCH
jgi:hypothetical protein